MQAVDHPGKPTILICHFATHPCQRYQINLSNDELCQTAWKHRLICAYVVRESSRHVFA